MWDQATSRSLISVIIRFRSNKWHPSENNLKPGGNLCAAIIYANASGADSPDYVTFWCLLIHHFCSDSKADSAMAQHRPLQRLYNINLRKNLSTGDASCTGQCRTTTCCWDPPCLTGKKLRARRRKLNPQWNTESCLSSHRRSALVFGLLETQFPSSGSIG